MSDARLLNRSGKDKEQFIVRGVFGGKGKISSAAKTFRAAMGIPRKTPPI